MSELPVQVDLAAYRGDSWAQQFRLCDAPDVAHDLTGASVEAWASNFLRRITLVVGVDAPNGTVTLSLPSDAIADRYRYDVEVTEASGSVTTWISGLLIVKQDVTHAV